MNWFVRYTDLCPGLLGLYPLHRGAKTKEIGIRKVLGASVANCIADIKTIYGTGTGCPAHRGSACLVFHERLA